MMTHIDTHSRDQPGSQHYFISYVHLSCSLQTDYPSMVISNGTNPISLHHFSFVLVNFILSLHPHTPHTTKPFLHSCVYLSHNPSLCLHPPLSMFLGNCFMALLVTVGRLPWVSGPVKGPSTLGPKPPFLSEFNTINSGMSQTHPIRFSVAPLPCLSQIPIISMDLLQYAVFISVHGNRTNIMLSQLRLTPVSSNTWQFHYDHLKKGKHWLWLGVEWGI